MLVSQRIGTIGFIALLLIGSLLLTPLSRPVEFRPSEEHLDVSPTQDTVLREYFESHDIISNTIDAAELRNHTIDPFRERGPWERDIAFWNESSLTERLRIKRPRYNLTIPVAAGIPHDPILITSDADFVSQGWPGAGTPADPYRIGNLFINVTYGTSCIEIRNSRVHFVIDNCTLHGERYYWAGIDLHNVSNGLIVNNTIHTYEMGIRLNASSWNTIYNNTIDASWWSDIYLNLSPNNSIINNTCGTGYSEIRLWSSNNNRLVNNTCYGEIRIYSSSNTTMSANTFTAGGYISNVNSSLVSSNKFESWLRLYNSFSNNLTQNTLTDWLRLSRSGNNSITHNSFSSYGITISGSLETTRQFLVLNNTINNQTLVFWQDQTGSVIPPDAGQIILVNCSGTIVSNQILTNSYWCIQVLHSQLITIQNNTCTPSLYGISINLYNTNASQILNNTCIGQGYFGSEDGICLEKSSNNVVTNNNCSKNDWGISVVEGSLNTVSNNTLTENDQIDIALSDSDGNILANNTADQISLWHSDSNTVTSNHLGGSRPSVLYLATASNNTICYNQFIDGGLYLSYTDFPQLVRQWLVTHNTVNGKPLIYLQDQIGGSIPNNGGQIVLVNCTEIAMSNFIISDCRAGIQLFFSKQCQVTGNTLTGSGIRVLYTNSTLVKDNTCTDNSDYGIYVSGVNITISQNTCTENSHSGIYIYGSNHTISQNNCGYNEDNGLTCWLRDSQICSNVLHHSSVGLDLRSGKDTRVVDNICTNNEYAGICVQFGENSIMANNTCSYNRWGIELYWCGGIVNGNTCNHNTEHGIYLLYSAWGSYVSIIQNDCYNNSRDGIHGHFSGNTYYSGNDCYDNGRHGIGIFRRGHNNTIEYNWCMHNGRDGIGMDENSNSSISYNVCSWNQWYGISLNSSSTNNTVMWNVFAVNGAANGFDNGSMNIFDYNFWADYLGTDWNFDGIGDTPYLVNGPSRSEDVHPLLQWPGAPIFNRIIIIGAALFVCGIVISVVGVSCYILRRQRNGSESSY